MYLRGLLCSLILLAHTAEAQQVQRAFVGFGEYYYEVGAGFPHIKMFFSCDRQDEYDIEVSYQTLDGTALAGRDYVATSGSFNFPAGSPTRTREIQVQIIPRDRTADRTFFVKLSAGFPAEVSRSRGEVPVTITDLPVLRVAKGSWNDEEIYLGWRASATNFVLEASSSLTNDWTAVPGTPTRGEFSPNQSIALPLSTTNKFFRLRNPEPAESP